MDLGAYAQIEDLENIAKDNGIEVPRLRGYRLMKEESKVDYSDMFDGIDISCVENLCESHPFWTVNSNYWLLDDHLGIYTPYPKDLVILIINDEIKKFNNLIKHLKEIIDE